MTKTILILLFTLLVPGNLAAGASFQKQQQSPARKVRRYECPMHPEVVSTRPRTCQKCGMKLRVVKNVPGNSKQSPTTTSEAAETKSKEGVVAPLRIPDTPVVDQSGRPLKFYTDLVKGRTVAISFIFTTCTTICPPITATFRRVQQELGDRVGHDIHLISVSVDPVTDVPERLNNFAAKFKAGPGWTFVTGAKPDIDQLLKSLGAGVADKNDHTAFVLIGNEKSGYWTRAYGLSPPSTLVKTIFEAAGKKAE